MIVKCRFGIQDQVAVAVDVMQNMRILGQKFLYLTKIEVLMPHHALYEKIEIRNGFLIKILFLVVLYQTVMMKWRRAATAPHLRSRRGGESEARRKLFRLLLHDRSQKDTINENYKTFELYPLLSITRIHFHAKCRENFEIFEFYFHFGAPQSPPQNCSGLLP